MSENANAKQRIQSTKSQIQLLKQKYLKKNISSPNVEKSKEEIRVKSETIAGLSNSQTPNKDEDKKENFSGSFDTKIDGKSKLSQWSLKDFLQKQNQSQFPVERKKEQNVDIEKTKINLSDPFSLSQYFKFPLPNQDIPHSHSHEQQVVETEKETSYCNSKPNLSLVDQQKDLSVACKIWIQSPQKALYYLYSTSGQTFEFLNKKLILTSRNPHFPGIVQQLAQQFIFCNSITLKDSQKQVVFNMALEYFCPSPSKLSDVLIVCLVKIMPLYATIYIDEIIRKIGYYMQKIISYKKYLLKQELDIFINCIEQRIEALRVDGVEFPNQTFCWLLILKPTSNYCNQVLLTRVIDNQKQLLTLFCCLFPQNKQSSISILYLKCIDSLVSTFVRTGILQKVISHLNEIKVSQVLYQPVKSLKLKLIRAADTGKDKRKVQEDKSFVNFLNEKITRFKDSLESKVSLKPKADLIYNFATQRYQPIVRPES